MTSNGFKQVLMHFAFLIRMQMFLCLSFAFFLLLLYRISTKEKWNYDVEEGIEKCNREKVVEENKRRY